MTRLVVFGALLFFIAGLAFLTVAAIIEEGLTVGTVVSVLVVALLSIGIVGAVVGALRNPPRDEHLAVPHAWAQPQPTRARRKAPADAGSRSACSARGARRAAREDGSRERLGRTHATRLPTRAPASCKPAARCAALPPRRCRPPAWRWRGRRSRSAGSPRRAGSCPRHLRGPAARRAALQPLQRPRPLAAQRLRARADREPHQDDDRATEAIRTNQ